MMQWSIHINSTMFMKQKQHKVCWVRKQKMFDDVENTGSKITYICTICRNCKVCKEHSSDEIIVKKEVGQYAINKSVKVYVASQRTTASHPLMNNPSIKLAHNKEQTLKVYNQQIKKLEYRCH